MTVRIRAEDMLGPKVSYSSNKMAGKALQRVPFLCSLWCSGLFWLRSSPLPQNRSLVLYSEGGVLTPASYSSFWLGKSWRPWALWSCDHARQIPCLPSETKPKKIITIIRFLWFCDVQTTSKCPLSFSPWLSSACWSGSPPARCTPPPAQTPLASPASSSCVWSCFSATDAGPQSQMVPTHSPTIGQQSFSICQLPCLRSLHQNQSYHSCHQMKRRRRRSPWVWAWGCDSSSNPFWSMEFGRPVSEEWQRQKSAHLWRCIVKNYIGTVEKNPCIFNLKAQPGNRVKKKNILSIFHCFWKT